MTNLLSPGINARILLALQTIFVQELQTAFQTLGDPLIFNVIKQADLQDDPTLVAPFLVYRDDHQKGHSRVPKELEHMYGSPEIGGPIKYLYFYEATFGTPLASSRDQARHNNDVVEGRIQAILEAYYDLSNIVGPGPLQSEDQSMVIESANDLLIDDVKTTILGGEQTFYGKGSIYWHYPVSSYTMRRGTPPF